MKKSKLIFYEILDVLKAVIVGLLLYLIFSLFFSVAVIEGKSMYPAYEDGNLVISTKQFNNLAVGDVIAFEYETNDVDEYHIKRIVGVPGDTVFLNQEKVYVNGECVIQNGGQEFAATSYYLDDDEYFVVGDNYDVSFDSRIHGPIKESSITGEVRVTIPFIKL
ncbi:MAG: signal peptidase I [Mycoplasmatales bacterium]